MNTSGKNFTSIIIFSFPEFSKVFIKDHSFVCARELSITGCKVLSCCWTSGNLLYTLESSLFSFWEHWKVLQCVVSKFSQTSTGEIKGPFVHIIKPPCSLVQLADSSPQRVRTKTAWVFLGQVGRRLAELCQTTSSMSSECRGSILRCSQKSESHKKQTYLCLLFRNIIFPCKSVCLKAVKCALWVLHFYYSLYYLLFLLTLYDFVNNIVLVLPLWLLLNVRERYFILPEH